MSARSKAWVCCRSPAEIVGSNPAGGIDVCLLWVLCVRGLCDGLITRPEESCPLWCVVLCDLETSWIRRPWPMLVRSATGKKKKYCGLHCYVSVKFGSLAPTSAALFCLRHNRRTFTTVKTGIWRSIKVKRKWGCCTREVQEVNVYRDAPGRQFPRGVNVSSKINIVNLKKSAWFQTSAAV